MMVVLCRPPSPSTILTASRYVGQAAATSLPDLAPSQLALPMARHLRLVHAPLSMEAALSGGVPMVPGKQLPSTSRSLTSPSACAGSRGHMLLPRAEPAMPRRSGRGPAARRPPSLGSWPSAAGPDSRSLLRGLRDARPAPPATRAGRDREGLTAIVTSGDDGGSSGRLREAYGILPRGTSGTACSPSRTATRRWPHSSAIGSTASATWPATAWAT